MHINAEWACCSRLFASFFFCLIPRQKEAKEEGRTDRPIIQEGVHL